MMLWRHEREVGVIKQTTVRIDDELLKQVKYKLIEKNQSFNEYIIELIRTDLKKSEE